MSSSDRSLFAILTGKIICDFFFFGKERDGSGGFALDRNLSENMQHPQISPSVVDRVLRRSVERKQGKRGGVAPEKRSETSETSKSLSLSAQVEEEETVGGAKKGEKRAKVELPSEEGDECQLLLLLQNNDDDDDDDKRDNNNNNRAGASFASPLKTPENNVKTPENNVQEEDFVGFSTGRNKRVTVSEESLKKAKGILANDEEPPQKEEEFVGFSTGKNKRVTVSEESLKKAKGILANDEEPPQKEEEFVGFSTGKNKRVTVSEESLKKAKGILASDEEPPQKEEEFVGFSTGKNKRVTVLGSRLAETSV
jgi:predicted double-glycine peptidase